MALDPDQRTPNSPHPNLDGMAKWLLGALGLLGVVGIAVRILQHGRRYHSTPPARIAGPRSQVFPSPIRGHETRDADAKWIFAVVLFLLVSGLAIHGILAGFLSALNQAPPPTDQWRPVEVAHGRAGRPPFPVLQVSPPLDLHAFRTRENAQLQSYGWINQTSGVVRIPIERAMEVILQEGLPTTATNQNQSGPSSYRLIQQRPEHRQSEIQGAR